MASWKEWLTPTGLSGLFEDCAAALWAPTAADRKAAWSLYTEIQSRITTQPLHYRSGDEATALKSVYELFGQARKLGHDHGPDSLLFTDLCWRVLNVKVRPFTARWHRRQQNGAFGRDDSCHEFRAQLEHLQPWLRGLEAALLGIARGDARGPQPIAPPEPQFRELHWTSPDALLGIDDQDQAQRILARETATIAARRRAAGSNNARSVGLALSGGGIRSASFSLGVVQGLTARGLLRDVDYLSTVSGGGYLGATLSALLSAGTDAKTLLAPDGSYLRHLRQRARRHLLGQHPDRQIIRLLETWAAAIAVHAALLAWIVAAGVAVVALVSSLGETVRTALGVGFGVLLGVGVWRLGHQAELFRRLSMVGLVGLAAGATFWLLDRAYDLLGTGFAPLGWLLAIGAALVVLARALRRRFPAAGQAALAVVATALIPLALAFAAIALQRCLANGGPWHWVLAVLAAGAVVLWRCDCNATSLHALYRDRLADTFSSTADQPARPPKLSELQPERSAAPYHLVNAAVNLPASKNPKLRGRRSDFFVFSQHYCGSPTTGYHETRTLEQLDPQLDLATAVAASAAAASPHMGRLSRTRHALWLALLNARLGYWLPNPKLVQQPTRPGFGMLWREFTSCMHAKLPFWNVTDGGHIENLGIYELLRRQCYAILAVDAEADATIARPGLMHCLHCAKIDLGIDVAMDDADFQLSPAGLTRAHFQLGVIKYPNGSRGLLLYLKLSMTGDESPLLLQYRARQPAFPHHSTADQFFDEEQFEMYRALGEHAARMLLRQEITGTEDELELDAASLFAALRRQLLPDDHESEHEQTDP